MISFGFALMSEKKEAFLLKKLFELNDGERFQEFFVHTHTHIHKNKA